MSYKRLQVTLYVTSAYLAFFGCLFAFAPAVAERITRTPLPSPAINLLYGHKTLVLAVAAFLAAREREPGPLSLVTLLVTAGHVVVFAYMLLSGIQSVPEAAVPLAVNSVLTVLLCVFMRGTPAS